MLQEVVEERGEEKGETDGKENDGKEESGDTGEPPAVFIQDGSPADEGREGAEDEAHGDVRRTALQTEGGDGAGVPEESFAGDKAGEEARRGLLRGVGGGGVVHAGECGMGAGRRARNLERGGKRRKRGGGKKEKWLEIKGFPSKLIGGWEGKREGRHGGRPAEL